MTDLSRPFTVNPAVVHKEIEGQIVLLLPDSYELYTLNATGRRVWRDLAGGKPLAEAAAALATDFGIPPEQAEGDVTALVRALAARGVIVAPSAEPAIQAPGERSGQQSDEP